MNRTRTSKNAKRLLVWLLLLTMVFGLLPMAAFADEAIQPDNSYRMSGNQISVKTLDLNRDFSEISAQLDAIVDEHFS